MKTCKTQDQVVELNNGVAPGQPCPLDWLERRQTKVTFLVCGPNFAQEQHLPLGNSECVILNARSVYSDSREAVAALKRAVGEWYDSEGEHQPIGRGHHRRWRLTEIKHELTASH